MKKIAAILVLVFAVIGANAQQQTLLSGKLVNGGYGGPSVTFTEIGDDLAVLTGGHGAWLINHSFLLGGGGCGLVNSVKVKDINADTAQYLNMGYGGGKIGFIMNPNSLVHISANALIGAGGLNFQNRPKNSFIVDDEDHVDHNGDAFFVLEPTVMAELNVVSIFRFGVGASYRYINGLENGEVTDSELSGPSVSLNLMFGRF